MTDSGTTQAGRRTGKGVLARHVAWVVRLRWVAGAVTLAGGLFDQILLHVHGHGIYGYGWEMAGTGAAILLYNIFFRKALTAVRSGRVGFTLALGQIIADMICLTLLVTWTGGPTSPLLGLFVIHMVFASLLLPRAMAFGVAVAAIALVQGMLLVMNSATGAAAEGVVAGWAVTLFATVYLASGISRDLRRKRRRLVRQTRRIERMSERLRMQQQGMAQQEKMVALGQMAAGVAHEVANPLASMDGLLQLLERRPEKISAENLTRLRDQVARINQIVRQLTTLARPGAGEGEWAQGSLNDVVTRALEVLRFDDRLRRITVGKSLDAALPPIRMQPAALEQVVINLVINACDAMEEMAAPRLDMKTQAREGWVELTISDNGPGIAQEVKGRIFEPFFTTKPVGKGTGLGLSISYSLVKKHGGEIEVISSPGKGTEVRMRLPQGIDSRK